MSEPRPKVLHYDDDATVAVIVEQTLRLWGMETLTVDSPAAVRAAAGEPWDLFLASLGQGEIGGLRLCQELRREGCRKPFIVLSSRTLTADERRVMEEVDAGLIVKPFGPGELIHRVRQAIAEESWH